MGAGPLTEECVAAGLAAPELRSAAPVRFFRSRLLERLTRAHPACPYVLFAPVIGWALWAAATAMGPRWGALAALFAGGWLSWTLLEYWLHRAIFHLSGETDARKVARFVLHTHHHRTPMDRGRLAATPFQGGSLALLLAAIDGLVIGGGWQAALAGQIFGYLVYEAAHYAAHHSARAWFGARLRRHHLRHHARSGGNFGISSGLWDVVFGTRLRGP